MVVRAGILGQTTAKAATGSVRWSGGGALGRSILDPSVKNCREDQEGGRQKVGIRCRRCGLNGGGWVGAMVMVGVVGGGGAGRGGRSRRVVGGIGGLKPRESIVLKVTDW